MDKFTKACFAICLILGFVAFGYICYLLIGYWTLIATSLFILAVIVGFSEHNKEIEELAIRRYERGFSTIPENLQPIIDEINEMTGPSLNKTTRSETIDYTDLSLTRKPR